MEDEGTSVGRSVQGAVARAGTTMNAALRKRCVAIRTCFARAASDDVSARYRVGQLLLDTRRKEHMYGANAVGQLGLALRRPTSTLYRYASVAESWSSREMKLLAKRPNAFGEPLSWSHWVELAQVRPRNVRERLRERALKEGLSVRELAQAVRLIDPAAAANSVSEESDDTMAEAIDEVARSCDRWSCQALAAARAIASRLKTGEATNPDVLGQIRRAVRAHEAVRERSEEALLVLRAALGALPAGPPKVPTAPAPRRALADRGQEGDRPRLMIAGMRP